MSDAVKKQVEVEIKTKSAGGDGFAAIEEGAHKAAQSVADLERRANKSRDSVAKIGESFKGIARGGFETAKILQPLSDPKTDISKLIESVNLFHDALSQLSGPKEIVTGLAGEFERLSGVIGKTRLGGAIGSAFGALNRPVFGGGAGGGGGGGGAVATALGVAGARAGGAAVAAGGTALAGAAAPLAIAGAIALAIVAVFKGKDIKESITQMWDVWFGEGKKRTDRMSAQLKGFWDREARIEDRLQIFGPFRERSQEMGRESARLRDRAALMGRGDRGALTQQADAFAQAFVGQYGGGDKPEKQAADIARVQEIATEGLERQRDLEREILLTEAERGRARKEQASLGRELAAMEQTAGHALALEADLRERLEAASERVLTLDKQRIDQMQEQNHLIQEQAKQLRNFAEQQRSFYATQAQAERDKLKTAAEQFGMLTPGQQNKAFRVAQRLQAGQRLTRPELEFAQSQGVFGSALQQYRERQAAQSAPQFQRLAGMLGADTALRQAEAKEKLAAQVAVQLQTKVDATINLNEANVANQIVQQLIPLIEQSQRQLARQAELAYRRNSQDAQNARRVVAGVQ